MADFEVSDAPSLDRSEDGRPLRPRDMTRVRIFPRACPLQSFLSGHRELKTSPPARVMARPPPEAPALGEGHHPGSRMTRVPLAEIPEANTCDPPAGATIEVSQLSPVPAFGEGTTVHDVPFQCWMSVRRIEIDPVRSSK